MAGGCKGRSIEYGRGYAIFEWEGPDVESGKHKKFTVRPLNSFDDVARCDTLDEAKVEMAKAPGLRKVEVTFSTYVPDHVTHDEIADWLRFELHETGSLSGENPMSEEGCLEAFDVWVGDIEEIR